jgi:HEPN domain-containing protein
LQMDSKVQYWIDLAEYDLKAAEAMLNAKMYLYVGFMCHQVIEKMLKSHYVNAKNATPPFIHNLFKLAVESGIYNSFSEEQKNILDELMPLNIEARYPTEKEELLKTLNHQKCRDLIAQTKELSLWIRTQLSIK